MEQTMANAENINLSENQIFNLLKDAEQRLKSPAGTKDLKISAMYNLSSQPVLQTRIAPETMEAPSPSYITSTSLGAQIDRSLLITSEERSMANVPRVVQESSSAINNVVSRKMATAGTDWYHHPRTILTPEFRKDMQLLRLRSVLDPHRHYKKDFGRPNQVPEYSQIGTIIEGPAEFFSSRLTNKERNRTFIEDVLAGEKSNQKFKTKYNEIQAAKTSGKKAYYRVLKAKRARKSFKG